jgi:hypothetical protein
MWEGLMDGSKSKPRLTENQASLSSLLQSSSLSHASTKDIILSIREATAIFEAAYLKNNAELDRWQASETQCQLQQIFASLESNPCALDVRGPEDYIYKSCRSAALIYCDSLYRQVPFSSDRHLEYVTQLKAGLGGCDLLSWIVTDPATFFWACLTGVTAAQNMLSKAWFVTQAGPALMALGHEDRIERGIAHFQWLTQMCEQLSQKQ